VSLLLRSAPAHGVELHEAALRTDEDLDRKTAADIHGFAAGRMPPSILRVRGPISGIQGIRLSAVGHWDLNPRIVGLLSSSAMYADFKNSQRLTVFDFPSNFPKLAQLVDVLLYPYLPRYVHTHLH
jgi:hypothetical protein